MKQFAMSSKADQHADFYGVTHDLLELLRPATPFNRACLVMLVAALTTFACVALLTVPGLIFVQADHNICFLFSRTLQTDHASFLPICLSGLSSAFALALPVPRLGIRPKHANCTSEWVEPRQDWRG